MTATQPLPIVCQCPPDFRVITSIYRSAQAAEIIRDYTALFRHGQFHPEDALIVKESRERIYIACRASAFTARPCTGSKHKGNYTRKYEKSTLEGLEFLGLKDAFILFARPDVSTPKVRAWLEKQFANHSSIRVCCAKALQILRRQLGCPAGAGGKREAND